LKNQNRLKKAVLNEPELDLRILAISKIKDEGFLAQLVRQNQEDDIIRAAIHHIKSADILFELAMAGISPLVVEQAAIKLAYLGDKRAITHYDDFERLGDFLARGSQAAADFRLKIIQIAPSIAYQETVDFLADLYLKDGKQRNTWQARQAQQSLRYLKNNVQSTPLAEKIAALPDLDRDVEYEKDEK